ncbi:MAG: hypothetical protein NZ890_00860, partial [Myxococcota bacterium]|nr:hypothetical protein [Myxococcota bacterium]
MGRCHVVLYASDHGFGHATRMLALACELRARGARVTLCAGAALPALRPGLERIGVEGLQVQLDVGLVACEDRLAVDEQRSCAKVLAWLNRLPQLVQQEANRLRAYRADLVIADAPAAAVAGAARAGVPAVLCSNFSWLDVYGHRFGSSVAAALGEAYEKAALGLRLEPGRLALSGPPRCRDVPGVLARPVRQGRRAVRAALGLTEHDPVLLLGLGRSFSPSFVSRLVPSDGSTDGSMGVRLLVPADSLDASPGGPMVAFATDGDTQDLVAAADAVLAKAGYSTIAEAALAGVPLLAVPVV